MGLGCGASLLKYLLIIFNLVFFVCGAAILGVSIWILVDDSIRDYIDIATNANGNNSMDIALYILIAVGAFTFLVGLFGCCGACQESTCMLCIYAVLVGIVFVLQIVGAILAGVFKEEIKDGLENSMADDVFRYVTDDTSDATTRTYYRMQHEFKCCGGKGYEDYQNSAFFNKTNDLVPKTCCVLRNDDPLEPLPVNYAACLLEAASPTGGSTNLYRKGCYEGFTDWIDDQSDIILGVALGLAAFQIVCIIFACCVRSKIQKSDEIA